MSILAVALWITHLTNPLIFIDKSIDAIRPVLIDTSGTGVSERMHGNGAADTRAV